MLENICCFLSKSKYHFKISYRISIYHYLETITKLITKRFTYFILKHILLKYF